MFKVKFTPLQWAVHTGALLLAAWLAYDYYAGNLGINPIQALTQRSGKTALVLLILSLSITPLGTLTGIRQLVRVRRPLGLYAFLFAAGHLLTFIGLDYGFDWGLLWGELSEKRYILVGLSALIILFALAATSFKWWMKRLGKNWKRLHRLVYLASGLVIVHYAWAKKGDLLSLQGDILQPLLFGVLVLLLLAMRLPGVRRRLSDLRPRFSRRTSRHSSTKNLETGRTNP